MPLTITKYRVECDVPDCDHQLEDTPSRLSSSGWGYLLRYSGRSQFQPFDKTVPQSLTVVKVICPKCMAQDRLADLG